MTDAAESPGPEPAGLAPVPVPDLADNPGLAAALRTARAWGVSPKRYFGWEPQTISTTEYDSLGRPARQITSAEPEWDDECRAMAQALLDHEATLCEGCRTPLAETTAVDAEDAYHPDGLPVRCHRCTAAAAVASVYEESAPHPHALRYRIIDRRRDGSGGGAVEDPLQ